MESLDNNAFFMEVQRDYYHCTDEKEKLNLRNALCEQLGPLMTMVVWQHSARNEFDFDMFQDVSARTLTTIIPGWKPTQYSTDGYYRRSFTRTCLNCLRKTKKRDEKETLIDPTIEWMWEFVGKEGEDLIFSNEFRFNDPEVQSAYEDCLAELAHDGMQERMIVFLRQMWNKHPFSRGELRELLDHAKVTYREGYAHCVPDVEQGVDNETLFGRLCVYLEPSVRDKVVKIFGGCSVKIPDWKGEK